MRHCLLLHNLWVPISYISGIDNAEDFPSRALNPNLEKMLPKISNSKNKRLAGGRDSIIPIGNLVLLHDHPEGRNKIKDHNKDELYVITSNHKHLNAYYIKPLGSKAPPKQINRRQMFHLAIKEEREEERKE